ncbi:MAG: dihydrolipoyl dehydrogenase [Gammaproteobacteria bacterium]|jgi:dihydrolipoamide dehydrogenase|nr:dihydrolipoyl dehydrogenase [Gammaproteobacteria bacterium]MBP6052042.1 dihydrolipoyl dehydrogenase [Pseudomonadales bacterium]MBK6585256.1 dihydrolipoyl dehydrogenase [Gammaproteobacteria bacterium]MBK7730717.1 dihydrolipoyl dehydrogenase [Gammaproteobacteria bacterium]MBK8306262.1 dihydrolipoyl dehydrogenase [Gammaproteobacteria bacterium]
MAVIEVKVPDLGDVKDVEIIEVHVAVGDTVKAEGTLITIETDKAVMEVPSSAAGVVKELLVHQGDRVSERQLILRLEGEAAVPASAPASTPPTPPSAPSGSSMNPAPAAPTPRAEEIPDSVATYSGPVDLEADLLVLGAGPGGYPAAFRAADLGLEVTLVERWATLGGVCLNVGCIPSKALLHAAKVIDDVEGMADCGLRFAEPEIDLAALRAWKERIVHKLTDGLATLAKQRNVDIVRGTGSFLSPHHLEVIDGEQRTVIAFRQCIIAAGSECVRLPGFPEDPRIIDSTGALDLRSVPTTMLVVGGGIIGLEMASVYSALGTKISVVELTDSLMPGCDPDLVRPLQRRIAKRYAQIMTGTKVTRIVPVAEGLQVSFEGRTSATETYDQVLMAVGRTPNGKRLSAERAGIVVDQRGFIPVDKQMRTNLPHIFAVGDIVGQPMLAHKANHEGRVAAEVAAGHKAAFDARVIPSVAYTDPEIAWAGMTETEAKAAGIDYGKGQFPWAASGRALGFNRDEGMTKLLFDTKTRRVIGAGIVGPHAGDLISEVALAIEMGCDAADIGLTIHPHPTLSETVAFAAEAFEGTLVDLYLPKKK